MLQELAKNLWLLLTVVIPGLFTYGAWKLLLLFQPSARLTADALKRLDDSAITATAVIVAVALLQQAVGIAVEAILALVAKIQMRRWPNFYVLFCERFTMAASGKLNENATRILGNFFLSVNVSIGLILLLIYFLAYEEIRTDHWVSIGLLFSLFAALAAAAFRMLNAKWAIAGCGGEKVRGDARMPRKHAKSRKHVRPYRLRK